MTEQQLTEQLLAMKSTELYYWIVETRARLRQLQISEHHRLIGVTPNARDQATLATIRDVIAFMDAMQSQIGKARRYETQPLPAVVPGETPVIEDLGEGDEDVSRAKTLELVALQQVQRRLKRKGLLRW